MFGYIKQVEIEVTQEAVRTTPETVEQSAAQASDIILMHDGGRGINHPEELVKVLPEFLSNLGRRGLAPSLLPVHASHDRDAARRDR